MQRVTMVLDDELLEEVDRLVKRRGYQNRSEALRDLARSGLRATAEDNKLEGDCIAALVYSYDHHERNLPKRLTQTFHDHHDLTVSALHVHLDHDTCMEISVLRGDARDVRHLADHVIAERGVRHGKLVVMPATLKQESHGHGSKGHKPHLHVRVKKAG
jgi:CopG family nickel-responsive transcriptional regulator